MSFIGKIAKLIKGNFSGVYVASKTEFTNNGKGNGNTDGVRIENYPGEVFFAQELILCTDARMERMQILHIWGIIIVTSKIL